MRIAIKRKYLVHLEQKCLCSKYSHIEKKNKRKLFWSKWRRMKKMCDKSVSILKRQIKYSSRREFWPFGSHIIFIWSRVSESLISDFYFPLQVRVLLHRAVIGSYVEYWLKRSALNMLVVIDLILWWIWYLMDTILCGSHNVMDLILWWIWYCEGSNIVIDLILWGIQYCDGSDNVMDLIMTKLVTLSYSSFLKVHHKRSWLSIATRKESKALIITDWLAEFLLW